MHPCRRAAAGFHHRAPVQTDSLRLPERHRADRADQPAAQAVRYLRQERGAIARYPQPGCGPECRRGQLDDLRGRGRYAGGDPPAQAFSPPAGHPYRGGRGDPGGRPARSRRWRRGQGPRLAAPGPAVVRRALDNAGGPGLGDSRRLRRRPGFLRRHQRAVPYLRGEDWQLRQPQPGNDRPGGGQPGRRFLPGFPGQQQFVPHAGCRGRRRADPAQWRHRRMRRGPAAAVRARVAAPSAQ
ncbi:hypothetical protein D3C84_595160 [compost metagenome]